MQQVVVVPLVAAGLAVALVAVGPAFTTGAPAAPFQFHFGWGGSAPSPHRMWQLEVLPCGHLLLMLGVHVQHCGPQQQSTQAFTHTVCSCIMRPAQGSSSCHAVLSM